MTETRDLLFELGTEELPPKSLTTLRNALAKELSKRLSQAKLEFSEIKSFVSPRRLAVIVHQLVVTQPDIQIDRKGPAKSQAFDDDGKPTKALEGFLRSCNTTEESLTSVTTDKGEWLYYKGTNPGKQTVELLPIIVEQAVKALPFAKPMKWSSLDYKFARPIRWAVLLFGQEVLKTSLYGVTTNNITYGHRFMAKAPININTPSEYVDALKTKGFVLADFEERKAAIKKQLAYIANSENATIDTGDSLLDEVTSIVEWPEALLATFDDRFLKLPKEVLVTSMKVHQKCFSLSDKTGKLINKFITIANIACDNKQNIVNGNERVMHARLSDAEFFYNNDLKNPLKSHQESLKKILFQKQLGSLWEKAERVMGLSQTIAETIGASLEETVATASLCKCDLATDMVGEFPELQGIMGAYYAQNDGLSETISKSIETHYYPRFADDKTPTLPEAISVSIADKLDTVVGIYAIGDKPTGEKDPFALRRAMLGIIKTILNAELKLDLAPLVTKAISQLKAKVDIKDDKQLADEVLRFCDDRLKALFLEQGFTPDVVKSVLTKNISTPYDFFERIKAVKHFITLNEAYDLAEANKRVKNILQKNQITQATDVDPSLLKQEEEATLYELITHTKAKIYEQYKSQAYQECLTELASLHASIDAFFTHVMVMADDAKLKQNRLGILYELQGLFNLVADISEIQKVS